MKQPLNQIYDTFAETYEENRGLFDMTHILESFYEHISTDKGHILDLGCGAGEPFSRFFADNGWSVTGVDFSRKMLEMASRFVPEMKTILQDMCKVEFEPQQFDAITAIYSLFHVPHHEHPQLFSRWHHWLKPGGLALFTYATQEYTGEVEFNGYKTFMNQELFYSHKQPKLVLDELQQIGFTIEASDYHEIGGETFLWVTVRKAAACY